MSAADQPRDDRGRWTAGSGGAEQSHRDAGRFPVAPHNEQHSVGTHTGIIPSGAQAGMVVRDMLTTAARERVALRAAADARTYGRPRATGRVDRSREG